mgnify:CR=1 FL=1
MKCPEEMTREMLWRLLGEYALDVALAEGVFLTDDPHVLLAAKQREDFREDVSDD